MLEELPLVAFPIAVAAVGSTLTSGFLWWTTVGSESSETLRNANYAQVLVLLLIGLFSFGQLVIVLPTQGPVSGFGMALSLNAATWMGASWLIFALLYTGRPDLVTGRLLQGLAIGSLAIVAVVTTNSFHEAVFVDPVYRPIDGHAAFEYDWGIGAWLVMLWALASSLIAIRFLFQKFLQSRNVYRKISFFHVLGGVILNGGSLLSVAGLVQFEHLVFPTTAFAAVIVVSGPTVLTYQYLQLIPLDALLALFGGRFRSLTPMARDTIIQNIDSGVIVLDHENRIVDINPLGRLMIGGEDRRVVGQPLESFLVPSMFRTDDTGFLDSTTTDGRYRAVWTSPDEVDEDFEERCYDVQITALGASDDPAGRVMLVNDVTDHQIRKTKLEERTRELERQNEQLDQFAGIVSHDLRNPLTVAKGYIDNAHDANDPGAMLDEAEHSLDRMEAIIEDVLTLARDGQTIGSTESVALEALAGRAWENVATPTATLEIELDSTADVEDVPLAPDGTFDADPDRVLNLFENLFRNSVEHSDDAVTVTVGLLEDGFYVADDGPGIPSDQRQDVTAFGFTTSDQGTGFGLAIVDQIAQAHNWTLTVAESATGGARFEFHDVSRPGTSSPARHHLD